MGDRDVLTKELIYHRQLLPAVELHASKTAIIDGEHHATYAEHLEIRVLLEELLDRYTTIERDGEPVRLRSNFLNGVKHLPIRLQS